MLVVPRSCEAREDYIQILRCTENIHIQLEKIL